VIGEQIGIDWVISPFDAEQCRIGMNVELEHGLHDPLINVTDDDPLVTAKDRARTPERVPRGSRRALQIRAFLRID
jgi:hypothetical protein